jgi:hypothetical protein
MMRGRKAENSSRASGCMAAFRPITVGRTPQDSRVSVTAGIMTPKCRPIAAELMITAERLRRRSAAEKTCSVMRPLCHERKTEDRGQKAAAISGVPFLRERAHTKGDFTTETQRHRGTKRANHQGSKTRRRHEDGLVARCAREGDPHSWFSVHCLSWWRTGLVLCASVPLW